MDTVCHIADRLSCCNAVDIRDGIGNGGSVNQSAVFLNGKADDIGNIEVEEYVVDADHPEKCAECDLLAKEIAELKASLDIVTNMKDGYAKDLEIVTENLINARKELSIANNALAAERGSNELYVTENSQLKDKLNKIKEIVGG